MAEVVAGRCLLVGRAPSKNTLIAVIIMITLCLWGGRGGGGGGVCGLSRAHAQRARADRRQVRATKYNLG